MRRHEGSGGLQKVSRLRVTAPGASGSARLREECHVRTGVSNIRDGFRSAHAGQRGILVSSVALFSPLVPKLWFGKPVSELCFAPGHAVRDSASQQLGNAETTGEKEEGNPCALVAFERYWHELHFSFGVALMQPSPCICPRPTQRSGEIKAE